MQLSFLFPPLRDAQHQLFWQSGCNNFAGFGAANNGPPVSMGLSRIQNSFRSAAHKLPNRAVPAFDRINKPISLQLCNCTSSVPAMKVGHQPFALAHFCVWRPLGVPRESGRPALELDNLFERLSPPFKKNKRPGRPRRFQPASGEWTSWNGQKPRETICRLRQRGRMFAISALCSGQFQCPRDAQFPLLMQHEGYATCSHRQPRSRFQYHLWLFRRIRMALGQITGAPLTHLS